MGGSKLTSPPTVPWTDKPTPQPSYRISNTANNLFLYVTYRFFSLAYRTLITIFGNPTFIYSRHGFYKYVLFSFFHLFLRKSVGKGTEKYFPLTLMRNTLDPSLRVPQRPSFHYNHGRRLLHFSHHSRGRFRTALVYPTHSPP